jgi:hypothetical protein
MMLEKGSELSAAMDARSTRPRFLRVKGLAIPSFSIVSFLANLLVLPAMGFQTVPPPTTPPEGGQVQPKDQHVPATTTPPAPQPEKPVSAGNAPPPATVKVDRLILSGVAYCGDVAAKPKECRLGDPLFVGFTNLHDWLSSGGNTSDLNLVLNDRVVKGLSPAGLNNTNSGLIFDLNRLDGSQSAGPDNRDTWSVLVGQLRGDPNMRIGVAAGTNAPFDSSATVRFKVFPSYTWLVIIFLVALLALFLILARSSDILRDSPSVGNQKQSYSLARCQMAWWFFIVAAAYNYIWLILGNHDSLTQGALILTGISAGTGLAASVIDSNKREQRQQLRAEKDLIDARLAQLPALIAAAPTAADAAPLQAEKATKNARLTDVITALANLPSPIGPSEGFLKDILRDETGVSFHRFQMAAWTVILGFVFIASVYSTFTMPDFSATLLGLMGISSGTYIGFKVSDSPK